MDLPAAREQYAIWLALVRGELTEAEAAVRWGLEVAAVRRIRQVAEQGAMAALSTAQPTTTAQVAAPTDAGDEAARRIRDLLADSPVFEGIAAEQLAEFATAAAFVVLGPGAPVTDQVAAGPLLVDQGVMLIVDARGAPVDLVAHGAYRGPRVGRRIVPLSRAAVAALPMAAVDAAGLVPRGRLAAGARLGGQGVSGPTVSSAPLGAAVLGDLLHAAHDPADVQTTPGPPVDAAMPRLPRGTALVDALIRFLDSGATTIVVTEDSGPGSRARPIGTLSLADLPLPGGAVAADLGNLLAERPTLARLKSVVPTARTLVRSLLITGTDAADAGRLLAAVSDQLMRQLLAVARADLGAPPGAFAWLVFGSHARRELTPGSDQDTGLVYDSDGGDADRQWFAELGAWMTDALQESGFAPCPGGVMASRPDWRHDFAGWQRVIRRWTNPTETDQLLGADIGLDVRAVAGSGGLDAQEVARHLAEMVADASRGQLTTARLVRAAVARRPPSPAWGKVARNPLGPPLPHRERRFDLKRHGIQPIVDLARLHTLMRGGTELNTTERLAAAAADGALGMDLAATLVEGLRLLTWTRMSAQLSGADAGGNHVEWTSLSVPLRTQFSETFGAIRSAQDALRARYRLPPRA